MAWFSLIVAGLLEVAWAVTLPATAGFTRPAPTALFLLAMTASMLLLSVATRTIPIGTAYAAWVGIGAVGTVLFGIVVRGEQTSAAQLASLALLVLGIVAVKLTAVH